MVDSAIWCLIKSDKELLKKVIDSYEPDKIIESLDIAELRFTESIKEIDIEVEQLQVELKSYNEIKNIPLTEFMKPIMNEVKALGKKRGTYSKELERIKIERNSYNYDYEEMTKLFNQSIKKIEKSKALLKQYINAFIEEINPVVQNTKFSILRLKFKQFTNDRNKYIHTLTKDSQGFFKETFILIDKRYTLGIKTYQTDVPITYIDDLDKIFDLNTLKNNNIWKEYSFKKF